MLTVVSESIGRAPVLIEVARELSLTVTAFGNVENLGRQLGSNSRRIVILAERDLSDAVVDTVLRNARQECCGIIVCADRKSLRERGRDEAAKRLAEWPNLEWATPDPDVAALGSAVRRCRRRLLRLGKSELERALVKRELFLQYQPKVERGEGDEWTTREAEALIRWRHPEHGLLGPLEFLPEAEAFDLIGALSEFVLRETASQLCRWRKRGFNLNGCINLASSQLKTTNLADTYQKIVEEQGLECTHFTFEVTERDVVASEAPHLKVLNELRARGFRVSLDDFGVAVASLGTFEQLPFDEIKIHGSALLRAQANPVAMSVLAAVTGLAHKLGIAVCAEGVEDEKTYEFLRTIGCDKMQGYMISEAVMPDIIRRVYSAELGPASSVA
jgi:EAL domain-containing protein (putative c-di-GMP-specific phosphodiesterase class I)